MLKLFILIICTTAELATSLDDSKTYNKTFPNDFLLGFATAAYQIEGGWDADGKGENIWDRLVHTNPGAIKDRSTGDIACDSYHHLQDDIQALRDMGAQAYRLSISWSRILPTGLPNQVNEKGIDYYQAVLELCRMLEIQPVVTLYHWDLPQRLQDMGGWLNPEIVTYFRDYARLAFERFGDKVEYWLTFNEPQQFCLNGYGNTAFAPALGAGGIADYQCAHNVIKSHAAAYHLYDEEFRNTQGGRVGIALAAGFTFRLDDDPKTIEAQERNMAFDIGWFSQPIFSKEGNYPRVMIDRIANRSKLEGFSASRLPEFTQEDVEYIRGTADFFGVNHYTSGIANYSDEFPIGEPNFYSDKSTTVWSDDSWGTAASTWLRIIPEGMRQILIWVYDQYEIEMMVTECGFSDTGEVEDDDRIEFFKQYLSAVLQALHEDNVPVVGFTAWSLLDNFEWQQGYTERFGIYGVDFDSIDRNRTAKKSANFFKQLIATRCLLENGTCES